MSRKKTSATRAALLLGSAAALALAAPAPAQAAVVMTMVETPTGVVVTGSGSVNLGGASAGPISYGLPPGIWPADGRIGFFGPASGTSELYLFPLVSLSPLLGAGQDSGFTPGTGDDAFMVWGGGTSAAIAVPVGYQSGDPLSMGMTFFGATFASLQVTPGTYVWAWGSGDNADTATLTIGSVPDVSVPAPAALSLMAVGLLGLGAAARRRRKPA